MRRRSWAVVSAAAALTALLALVCGFVVGVADDGGDGDGTVSGAVAGASAAPGAGSLDGSSGQEVPSARTSTRPAPAPAGSGSSGVGPAESGSAERPGQESSAGQGGIDTGLTDPVHGAEAVKALGDTLPAVAARVGLSADELRGVLTSDDTAWVTPTGRLAYHEEIPTAPTQSVGFSADPLTTPLDLNETFTLHSLPGSSHTLYLDFDGVTVSANNAWHTESGVPVGTYTGWDPSGNGPAFTDAEKAAIQEIWARVAEDYAAFDINVTTQAPSAAALAMNGPGDTAFGVRVVFSDASTPQEAICGSAGCGGVAWFDVIDWPVSGSADENDIAWVFPRSLSNMSAAIAEAASHEAGHTFGLVHDGDDPAGDSYYEPGVCPASRAGDTLSDGTKCEGLRVWDTARPWASIMGASYYNAVTQWSKGGYPGARNYLGIDQQGNPVSLPKQDDVAVIRGIAGTRSTPSSSISTPLSVDPSSTNYITSATQADVFALGQCDPGATVSAHAAQVGANLDIALQVVDASSASVTGSAQPANPEATQALVRLLEPWLPSSWAGAVADGLGVSATIATGGGPYFAVIGGGGGYDGDWAAGGWDSYGSLGAYRLEVSGCDTPATVPGAPRHLVATTDASGTTATWSAPASNGGSAIEHYLVRVDGADAVMVDGLTYTDDALTTGTHTVSVRAVNAEGQGAAATVASTLVSAPGLVSGLGASVDSVRGTIALRWRAPSTGSAVTRYVATIRSGSAGGAVVAERTFASAPAEFTVSGLRAGSYTATVRASNAGGSSTATLHVRLPAYTPPLAPRAPSPSIKAGKKGGKKTVVFSWRVPSVANTPRATAYRLTVYRVVKGKAKRFKTITATSSVLKRELTLAAKKGVKYSFTVQVRNSVGWSPASKRSRATAPR